MENDRASPQITPVSSGPSPTAATAAASTTNQTNVTYDSLSSPNETSPTDNTVAGAGNLGPGALVGDDGMPNDPLADLKRPRACEACRQLKVRCDPDPNNLDGSCKRCAKARRKCVVTVPTRKRQKKADSRVAELERKIDALTASLHESRAQSRVSENAESSSNRERAAGQWPGNSYGKEPSRRVSGGDTTLTSSAGLAGSKRRHNGDLRHNRLGNVGIMAPFAPRSHTPPTDSCSATPEGASTDDGKSNARLWLPFHLAFTPQKLGPEHEYTDIIDREIIDTETATKAFDRYVKDMAPLLPAVIFPPNTTMSDVRRNTPILFLAIMSISIGAFAPSLQLPLTNEVNRVFAEQVVVRGSKSLEIVQAIVVVVIWYVPPDHFEEVKFYQLTHLAVVVGMELGMNRRAKPGSKSIGILKELMGTKAPYVDPECLDARRAWLGCYFLGVNASMGLRRPLLTCWNPYMDETLEMLEKSPKALPSDRALVAWVRLVHICEEVGFQFSMSDPTVNVSMADPRIQYSLKRFEGQLEEWRQNVPADVYSPLMQHYEHIANVYMHEIGMHIDHNIDDFKLPFLADLGDERKMDLDTSAHVDALTACFTSAHKAINILSTVDWKTLQSSPTVHFVRTSYGCIALIKLHLAASASGTKLANVFNPADFKVEEMLDKLIHHLHGSSEHFHSRTSSKFTVIIGMLKAWYMKRKQPITSLAHGKPKDDRDIPGKNYDLRPPPPPDDPQKSVSYASSTPLHVLSAVATSHPTETNSVEQHTHPSHQHQQLPTTHTGRDQALAMPSNVGNPPTLPTTSIPVISNSVSPMPNTGTWPQFTHQEQPPQPQSQAEMGFLRTTTGPSGLAPNYASLNSFPLGYADPNQNYMPQPGGFNEAATAQQNLWPENLGNENDLSFALTFHPDIWDDDFLSSLGGL